MSFICVCVCTLFRYNKRSNFHDAGGCRECHSHSHIVLRPPKTANDILWYWLGTPSQCTCWNCWTIFSPEVAYLSLSLGNQVYIIYRFWQVSQLWFSDLQSSLFRFCRVHCFEFAEFIVSIVQIARPRICRFQCAWAGKQLLRTLGDGSNITHKFHFTNH